MIDGNGNRAELHYDGYGRQDRWTFPAAARPAAFNDANPATALASAGSVNAADHEDYEYDANGNRTSLRKRDGRHIAFAYDALNRATSKTYPDGGARPVHYGYDLGNRQLFARFDSPSGEGITNAWDGFGRQLSSSTSMGGVTRTLSYGYDAAGNRTSITHPDNIWFGMWYDALGRQYYLHANNALGLVYMYFAPHGGISAIGRPGIASWINYDSVQRPQTLSHLAYTPAATDVAFSFGRNRAGQLTSIVRDNDSYAWTGHYGATRAYATNGLNQYTAIDSTTAVGPGHASYSFDPNGNLTSDGANAYLYDVENRLVSASGAHNAALAYDPLGRLFQVTGTGGAVTQFVYDGEALVVEYDGSNHVTRRHAHWEGVDVPVATFNVPAEGGLGTLRNLFADQQGSIVAQGDGAGAVTAINRYDEYGIPAASNTGRFQYTGQAWLSEIGMYYYKARIYSPTLGRFMQTDPIGYDGGINLYAYVGNDAINHSDPSGMWVCANAQSRTQCGVVSAGLAQLRSARQYMSGAILKQTDAILGAYGGDDVANGVQVAVGGGRSPMTTSTSNGITTVSVRSNIRSFSNLQHATGSSAAGAVAHEGDHIINETQRLGGRDPRTRQEWYNSERRGYAMQGLVDRALGFRGFGPVGGANPLWQESWRGTPDAVARMNDAARIRATSSTNDCTSCTGAYDPW